MAKQKINKLTIVERRIVQRLLKKNTAEDIAEIIERPVELVIEAINEFTSHNPDRKSFDQKNIELVAIKKKTKAAQNLRRTNSELERKQRSRVKAQPYQAKKKKEKVFADRVQDYSKKVAVKIDHKTTVYVDAGTDIDAFKKKYKERDPTFLKPENPTIYVKKFKPTK